jgi:O-acetyl-ADP-ribose deacetylase (regulator of RNase III)
MDITTIAQGIILHQVNCKGVMGCGVALAIRNKWPKVYEWYRRQYHKAKPGMIQIVHIEYNLFVVNLFAQDRYGRDKRYTDYDALQSCLEKISTWRFKNHQDLPVYIPYKMGCGNAGGNWDIVYSIIQDTIPEAKIVYPQTSEGKEIKQLFKKVISKNLKDLQKDIEF